MNDRILTYCIALLSSSLLLTSPAYSDSHGQSQTGVYKENKRTRENFELPRTEDEIINELIRAKRKCLFCVDGRKPLFHILSRSHSGEATGEPDSRPHKRKKYHILDRSQDGSQTGKPDDKKDIDNRRKHKMNKHHNRNKRYRQNRR